MSNLAHEPGGIPQVEMRHRLRIAMEYAGLKPSDLADTFDVHRNTIGHYMSGKTKPSRAAVMAWGMRCGVPWEWLLYGTEPDDGGDAVTIRYPTLHLVAA